MGRYEEYLRQKIFEPEDIAGYEVKYDGAVRFLEYEDGTRVEGV